MVLFTKNHIVALVLLCFLYDAAAQILPPSRRTDWFNAGTGNEFIPATTVILTNFGADNTGVNPCNAAFQAALTALGGKGRIFIPAGVYRFTNTLNLPDSIIVEGAYNETTRRSSTTLIFQAPGNGIQVAGSLSSAQFQLSQNPEFGLDRLITEYADQFQVGDWVRVLPGDEYDLITNSYASGKTGQICRIVHKQGYLLQTHKPIRRDYSGYPFYHVVAKVNPRRQVHIKCLDIVHNAPNVNSNSANIQFRYAVDCSVSGVSSRYCNFSHIDIRDSEHITVQNSYFKEGHDYGGGGRAYGVVLQMGSGDCLVRHNVFEMLRHSMLMQVGANGNVVAYNYSRNPYWTQGFLPSNSAGDLVLHGNYVYANLFEGNVVQNIVIDNAHGNSGPLNTFFRNRAELYGLVMSSASPGQNFIANQITNTSSPFLGLYSLMGDNHFQFGNLVKGAVTPAGTNDPEEVSLFGYSFGSYYESLSSVPPIRATNLSATRPIEAQYRFLQNNFTALCAPITYPGTNLVGLLDAVDYYPNPFRDVLVVTLNDVNSIDEADVSIFNLYGQQVAQSKTHNGTIRWELHHLDPGTYFIVTTVKGQTTVRAVRKF